MRTMLYLAALTAMAGSAAIGAVQASVQERKNGEFIADHYPPEALKRGEQGRVAFRLTIDKEGKIAGCDVTESSGFAILDRETCELLVRYAHLKPVVDSDGRRIRATRSGHIVWTLPSRDVALATTDAVTMPKPDPMICKRTSRPGSLIIKVRRCMTKSEWALQERLTQDEVRRAQESIPCTDHGC